MLSTIRFSHFAVAFVLGFVLSVSSANAERCESSFSLIAAPELRPNLLPHVLNGQFRDGQLISGMHTWQGLEKFKAQLMRERGFTKAEADEALRVVIETTPAEPAFLHIDSRYFPGSKDTQKTLFPRAWNIAKVVESIRYVAQNPKEVVTRKNGEKVVSGVFDGVTIVLRVSPENVIRSAYPEIQRSR